MLCECFLLAKPLEVRHDIVVVITVEMVHGFIWMMVRKTSRENHVRFCETLFCCTIREFKYKFLSPT